MDDKRIIDLAEVMSRGYTGTTCGAVLVVQTMEKCKEPALDCVSSGKSIWFSDFCEDHVLALAVRREVKVVFGEL